VSLGCDTPPSARMRSQRARRWHANVRALGREQVRLARIPLMDSKGPCYARYVGAQLYRGETYYLQLDSHMTMVPRWCGRPRRS